MLQDHLMTRPLRVASAILLTASMELGRSAHAPPAFCRAQNPCSYP